MKILQVCAYAAPYPGNFINSLLELDKELEKLGHTTVYAFCHTAKDKPWCKELAKKRAVYFLPLAKARILPKTYLQIRKILKRENIDIVHSHFELYDLPLAIVKPKKVKMFWHLHDPLSLNIDILRKLFRRLTYGVFGRKAFLISVAEHYRQVVVKMGFDEKRSTTILNGIDTSRIRAVNNNTGKEFDFLTFGWDFYRKGADIIFKAMEKLRNDGYNVRLLFNAVESTWDKLDEYFSGNIPEYIEKCNPTNDINILFNKVGVFIQASRRETFSYAVGEAAYAGLPVISSDIPGLEWAKNLPTVSFFENEDVEALYALMLKHITKEINYTESDITATARIIENEFSTKTWSKRIAEAYKKHGDLK